MEKGAETLGYSGLCLPEYNLSSLDQLLNLKKNVIKGGRRKRTCEPKKPNKVAKKKRKIIKHHIKKKTLQSLPKRRAISNKGNSSGRNGNHAWRRREKEDSKSFRLWQSHQKVFQEKVLNCRSKNHTKKHCPYIQCYYCKKFGHMKQQWSKWTYTNKD